MEQKLYPIKFKSILKEKIWGGNKLKTILHKNTQKDNLGESWEISGVKGDVSIVSNGFLKDNSLEELLEIYMGDLVGDKIYAKFGNEFPLLFKFIDANQDLSIQVHPDDKLSEERHSAYGKTEMWYVINAEKGSQLVSGFTKETNKEEYLEALNSGNLTSLLQSHTVSEGDTFFIPAGNVHAIGSGILLAEIQQTSDVTYRIYDYDRKDDKGNTRELHTDLALDAINYSETNKSIIYKDSKDEPVNLAECEYFVTNLLNLTSEFNRDIYLLSSFAAYMCLDGEVEITCNNGTKETVKKGETILIPACIEEISITPKGSAKMLEVYIKS